MSAPDMAAALEAAFGKARTEAEAKRAAQLAADSVPTDNVTVLRERATRHAYQAVDEYWGYFNDIQTALAERVITPLLHTVSRVAAERDERDAAIAKAIADLRELQAVEPDHVKAAALFEVELLLRHATGTRNEVTA